MIWFLGFYTNMSLLFFYLFLALFVSFMCSILEAVLLSITPTFIGSLEDQLPQKKVLQSLKENIDDAISSILILNTIAHTMGAAGVGAEAVRIFGIEWQSLIAVILTLLILYFSEIIPKTIGATYWRELASPSAFIIRFLTIILKPFIWLSSQITRKIQQGKKYAPTREEIAAMADLGEQSGILEAREGQLIDNLLQLKEVHIKEILTPRSVVFALEAKTTLEAVLYEDELYTFSRIPIYEETRDNIIGMVFSREILKKISLNEQDGHTLKSIIHPLFRVPEHMPVYFLLDRFIQRKEHLFLVHDHFRQYSGIVTLEDAIETLLGREIMDEADKIADMQEFARHKATIWKQQLEKKVPPQV